MRRVRRAARTEYKTKSYINILSNAYSHNNVVCGHIAYSNYFAYTDY